MRRLLIAAAATAVLLLAVSAQPAAAADKCGRFTSVANGKDVHANKVGKSVRAYTVYVNSYLQACSKTVVRARHQIYFDTRAFPYGWTFAFSVSTRRKDGKWRNYKSKEGSWIFLLKGEQKKAQEVIFYQRRTVSLRNRKKNRLTRVHVRHCGCWIGRGGVPWGSTLKARYHPFSGPEAGPAH